MGPLCFTSIPCLLLVTIDNGISRMVRCHHVVGLLTLNYPISEHPKHQKPILCNGGSFSKLFLFIARGIDASECLDVTGDVVVTFFVACLLTFLHAVVQNGNKYIHHLFWHQRTRKAGNRSHQFWTYHSSHIEMYWETHLWWQHWWRRTLVHLCSRCERGRRFERPEDHLSGQGGCCPASWCFEIL